MKKILFLPLLFFTLNAFSQLNSGQWVTGGYTDFLYSSSHQSLNSLTSDVESTSLQLSLNGGYFIVDKLSVGLTGGILLANNDKSFKSKTGLGTTSGTSSDKSFGYVIGPFIKYYLLDYHHRVNIFINFSYGYNYDKQKTESHQMSSVQTNPSSPPVITVESSKNEQKVNANIFALSAGPAFFINSHTSLELGVGYSYIDYMKSKNSSNNLTASFGFQIFFGK